MQGMALADHIAAPALSMQQTLDDLAAEFELLGDWEERYRYVIELGRDLTPLSDAEHDDANKEIGRASCRERV